MHPFLCVQCAVVKFLIWLAIIIHDDSEVHKKASVKVYRKSLALAVKLNVIRCENTSSVSVRHQTLEGQQYDLVRNIKPKLRNMERQQLLHGLLN